MKKLLIVGSNSIHVYNYIELIKGYFDEVLLITSKRNPAYKVNSIEVNFHLGLNVFSSIHKIQKIIQDYRPSVVHIHQANSYAFITLLALRKFKIPSLLSAWGSDVLHTPKRHFLLRKMLHYNLNHVTMATSDSLFMANEMKSYNPQLEIILASFGINKPMQTVEKEHIIYSNRLHNSLYNIEKVINAFYQFSKNHTEWKLVIGAIGQETEMLKEQVKHLGLEKRVEFIGWVDREINEMMYLKAKIFISIPSSDATAISLLEAIAANCICFVSNLPANCEHILDGINGFIETDLDKIHLEKYAHIDVNVLHQVNSIRMQYYLKSYNKKRFIEAYETLLERKQ